MRVLSNEHASEMQLVRLYRQDTEIIRRHVHALLNAGHGAKQLASEYLAHLEMREQEHRSAA
jgi:hypothetical protein